MDRDEYIAYKSRADIVATFIGRLEKVEINDIQFIPALQSYVEDGDKERFEDYRRWYFVMDEPQRRAKVEEAEKKAKEFEERQNAADAKLAKLRERVEEYRRAYDQLCDEIDSFVVATGNKYNLGDTITLAGLRRFQEENDLNPCKCIYVEKDGKVVGVSNVFLNDEKRIILRLKDEGIPVPPVLLKPIN